MRISLDLYRILGVPIQATPEQIQQAFTVRHQHRPRQQYSSAAIAAREQLLQESFTVLNDPELRETYDQHILGSDSDDTQQSAEDAPAEGMELDDPQLVGASLLLLEQGEYELVVQLGEAYLQRPVDLNRPPTAEGISAADVILTVALGSMGLGRERWQQKQYEQAAQDLKGGLELLEREQLFPEIQAEIQTDLNKLRPYRILELVALPESQHLQRQQGLQLLQKMLDQRGGIDGAQDDHSGLDVDNFLRFVQQLRGKLTTQEQQNLFEQEAQRPSAIAAYLNVYTLVARGFSEGEPQLINRARTRLDQLADRQDIGIEKAIFSLLLGQPEAATQALQLSQDQESLDFIHQYSGEATDFIPGLYLYTERWLQQEVYPYFRNLTAQQVSLEDYFNNPKIQQRISDLSLEGGEVIKSRPEPLMGVSPGRTESATPAHEPTHYSDGVSLPNLAPPAAVGQSLSLGESPSPQDRITAPVQDSGPNLPPGASSDGIIDAPMGSSSLPTAASDLNIPPAVTVPRRRAASTHSHSWLPWIGGLLLLVLGGGAVIAMVQRCGRPPASNTVPATAPVSPMPVPDGGPEESGSEDPDAIASQSQGQPLSADAARQLVATWQQIKSDAMGKKHESTKLSQILTNPVLAEWVQSAESAHLNDSYWKYTLESLTVDSIKPQGDDQVSVIAQVQETAQTYQNGQLQTNQSYRDDYRVQYDFVRKDDKWLIQEMQVLP